jgi:hypothetical protein
MDFALGEPVERQHRFAERPSTTQQTNHDDSEVESVQGPIMTPTPRCETDVALH